MTALSMPLQPFDSEIAWRAVLDRDRRADGRFVYAVRSTGIYCQPSCPSRRPARGNVTFFPTGPEAEREGYRPCRRCGEAVGERRGSALRLVRKVCDLLQRHPMEPFTLSRLAESCAVSPFTLQRTFTRETGVSPRAYAESLRFGRLRQGLRQERTVSSAAYAAGFGSSSRLYEAATSRLGMTPASYRRGGGGETIHYDIVPSRLGRVLIAATAAGVCVVALGDSDKALEVALMEEFPRAERVRKPAAIAPFVAPVRGVIDGKAPTSELPLDARGTVFQARVWAALREIPAGERRTYAEVARRIGRPKAVRAVASAIAANPLAVLVPCHRVLRSDGGLGGYRWGLERKRKLLDRESKGG
jgi:AraC family transcriptional regulator of adaptative response/methylated-DNA-[protein]-cysteine methyltransferase